MLIVRRHQEDSQTTRGEAGKRCGEGEALVLRTEERAKCDKGDPPAIGSFKKTRVEQIVHLASLTRTRCLDAQMELTEGQRYLLLNVAALHIY